MPSVKRRWQRRGSGVSQHPMGALRRFMTTFSKAAHSGVLRRIVLICKELFPAAGDGAVEDRPRPPPPFSVCRMTLTFAG